jgi:hypothetical protein
VYKRQTIIIATLAVALALAGCSVETTPTATVTVTATPTPTPTATYTPPSGPELTAEEQRCFDFICDKYEVLARLNQTLLDHVDEGDLDDYELLDEFSEASETFIPIMKKWGRMDWTGGCTDDLEVLFHKYVNATRSYYVNWMSALVNENLTTQRFENIIKAEEKLDRFGPRIEREIQRLRYGGEA